MNIMSYKLLEYTQIDPVHKYKMHNDRLTLNLLNCLQLVKFRVFNKKDSRKFISV